MNNPDSKKFKVYPRRWGILVTVVLLNMSNALMWISYFPVSTTTVNYFEKTQNAINWFSYVFMIVPAICFFITTYLSNRHGLRFLVLTGAAFNLTGATIRAMATSGLIKDKGTQYTIALTGQVVAAVAQTFVIYIPTKVSHSWFPTNERGIVTAVLSLSYSLGTTLTQLITPAVVKDESDIPTLDYICFGIAALTGILAVSIVTRSRPKTSPSHTSGKENESTLMYWHQLKSAFTSRPFVVLLVMYSCGIGFIAGFSTLTQQMLCPIGYSDQFAGSCIAIMYFGGYLGASIITPFTHANGRYEEIVKLAIGLICLSFIGLCEVIVIPDVEAAVGVMFALFGFFATGAFPIGLELTVESTYPVDESIPIGLIYFFGQLFAILMIFMVPALAVEVDFDSAKNQCKFNSVHLTQLDYSISVSVIMVIFVLTYLACLTMFKPVFKRWNFEQYQKDQNL